MINFRWLGFMLLAAAAPLSVCSEAGPVSAPEPLLGYSAQVQAMMLRQRADALAELLEYR